MEVVKDFLRASRMAGLALGIACGLMATASTQAGVLNGHASAYSSGSTAFSNATGLSGTVDWAVFAPGDFPYAGYSPTAGEMTYTFQVFSTGTAAIHSLTLDDPNAAADNIGSFADLAGEAPTSVALGAQAEWNFAGLDAAENSIGLAFSSIKIPTDLFGVIVNGGSFAVAIPLPVPSSVDIPEPASLALLGAGGLFILRRRD